MEGCVYCAFLKLSFDVWSRYSILTYWSVYCVHVLQVIQILILLSASIILTSTLGACKQD